MTDPRVLICGYRAFACEGLPGLLSAEGCKVDGYARRSGQPIYGLRNQISGDASQIDLLDGFDEEYDIVVNFLLLKDEDIERNKNYLDSLIRLCIAKRVKHLIHISSVSVYPGKTSKIDESTPMETNPDTKGRYGALKVASDRHLLKNLPSHVHLSLVRPGFILGKGLVDPIVGMAFRTPFNRLLVLGDRKNVVPITTKELVHQAICKLALAKPAPETASNAYLLVSPDSPTREVFLNFLCRAAGFGKGILWVPRWLWKATAYQAGIAESLLRLKLNVKKTLLNASRQQNFDSSETAKRLAIDLNVDWKTRLVQSLESQEKNFVIPEVLSAKSTNFPSIGFIGWGRIVKQKHLPALKILKCKPAILAYDLKASVSSEGQSIRAIDGSPLEDARLYVVATPGPAHGKAVAKLEQVTCPIIVEKPLAYDPSDLDRWLKFSAGRQAPVMVCHNYRFKANVNQMWELVEAYNPGPIQHVDVWFQSPPVANEGAVWLKDERKARTLLYDYGIHFLDVACMLSKDAWKIDCVRAEQNSRQETSLIQGQVSCDTYSVSFLMRQGSIPRRASLRYVFQNYDVTLDFFPETFSTSMGSRSPSLMRRDARTLSSSIRKKAFEKIMHRDSDTSHATIYRHALESDASSPVSVQGLESFYRLLYAIGDRVYS